VQGADQSLPGNDGTAGRGGSGEFEYAPFLRHHEENIENNGQVKDILHDVDRSKCKLWTLALVICKYSEVKIRYIELHLSKARFPDLSICLLISRIRTMQVAPRMWTFLPQSFPDPRREKAHSQDETRGIRDLSIFLHQILDCLQTLIFD